MTAISKDIYFDMLDDIVNKYNNTVHKTFNMKPIEVTSYMLNTMKIQVKRILNLTLVIMLEFENTKTFWLKDTLQISRKKFSL